MRGGVLGDDGTNGDKVKVDHLSVIIFFGGTVAVSIKGVGVVGIEDGGYTGELLIEIILWIRCLYNDET